MTILGTEGECSPRIRNEIIVIPEIERTKKKDRWQTYGGKTMIL
jgi:hypothetical protein